MIDKSEAHRMVATGCVAIDREGRELGPVRRVFLDDYTDWPSFATVCVDPESAAETFVALHEAALGDSAVTLPYDRQFVLAAPQVSDVAALSAAEENALFDYYGVPIDGVVPSVEHLGAVMTPADGTDVVELPVARIG